MKLIFTFAAVFIALGLSAAEPVAKSVAPNQTNSAPATNAPAPDLGAMFKMHWENRVRSFKEQNLALRNVVLLGDSITEGFDVAKYLPGRRVLNRGIGADIIGNALPADDKRGILRRLDNSVFDCAATDVFLLIGINDLGAGRKVEVMEEGYREILQRIKEKAPAIRVHVQALMPTRDRFAKHNAPVLDFNERLRKIAAEFGCNFIDLHKLMADGNGELKSEFTRDGLHLTEPAYHVWREEILKAMKWQ